MRTEDTEQVGPRKGDRTEAGRELTPEEEEEEDITEEPATEGGWTRADYRQSVGIPCQRDGRTTGGMLCCFCVFCM